MAQKNRMLRQTSSLTESLKLQDKEHRAQIVALAEASFSHATRNDLLPHLEIIYLPISDLKAPKYAVRKLEPAHVRELGSSVGMFGIVVPVLLGKGDTIISGNALVEAAKLEGLTSVPCIRIHHLSLAEQDKLRIALNRLGEKGKWDIPELKLQLEEIRLSDPEIIIPGLPSVEIDQIMLCGEDGGVESAPPDPKPDAIAITEFGDVFRAASHLIVCGDSTIESTLRQLMAGDDGSEKFAAMVLTDPPYNVRIAGNVTRGKHREFAMASGEMTPEQFENFHKQWMACALPCLCDGGVLASFMDWRGLRGLLNAAKRHDLDQLNLLVWSKTNAGMGSLYRSQHELVTLFKKGDAAHINNVKLGRHGRSRSNVWPYAGASSVGSDVPPRPKRPSDCQARRDAQGHGARPLPSRRRYHRPLLRLRLDLDSRAQ